MTMTNWSLVRRTLFIASIMGLIASSVAAEEYLRSPQPGEVYKEFTRIMNVSSLNQWRVTDPNAPASGDSNVP